MSRSRAIFLLILLWALIYLPGLGSTEIKGEEGRRILPAVTMLDDGNWLVPHVGGKPFLRKPPLMNWLIAGSFQLSGMRNEWSARMPAVLLVLALALTIVGFSGSIGFLSVPAGFTAALLVIIQFGLLAKARFAGAEIEGAYVPICGLAFVTWLACWCARKPPWITWTLPFVFLGLASLTKGPIHFLFFYAIVMAASWRAGRLRELLSPWHLAGLVIAGAIFAAWAVPYLRTEEAMKAASVWKDQFAGRITGNVFNWRSYLLNIPRALADQLPVVLLAPILAARPLAPARLREEIPRDSLENLLPAILCALAVCFFGLLLVPGVLPRYVLPLGVPFCLLIAERLHAFPASHFATLLCRWHRANRIAAALLIFLALVAPLLGSIDVRSFALERRIAGIDWQLAAWIAVTSTLVIAICARVVARRSQQLLPVQCVLATAALYAGGSILFATAAVPWMQARERVRPLAAQIDATIAQAAATEAAPERLRKTEVVLFDPGWWPAIFYLRTPYRYAANIKDIPRDAQWVITRAEDAKERAEQLEKFARKRPELEMMRGFAGESGDEFLLLRRRAAILESEVRK